MSDVKITELPAVTTVVPGTDVAPLVSGGATKKVTPQQLVNAALASPTAIGSGTPAAAKFTTLQTTGLVAMTGAATAGNALVQISNTGAGYALLVEDESNPDATPFAIHESGGVSIGNTLDAGAGNLFVLGNVAANVVSALQQMTVARSGGGQVMQLKGSSGATNAVLTVSTNDAAGGVFININTPDNTSVSYISFTGIGGSTMWTMTSTGDFFPRQGSTSMKEGFSFVPGGAGAPTEIPTNENTGITPLYYDETNNRLYAYNGGWKYTQFA